MVTFVRQQPGTEKHSKTDGEIGVKSKDRCGMWQTILPFIKTIVVLRWAETKKRWLPQTDILLSLIITILQTKEVHGFLLIKRLRLIIMMIHGFTMVNIVNVSPIPMIVKRRNSYRIVMMLMTGYVKIRTSCNGLISMVEIWLVDSWSMMMQEISLTMMVYILLRMEDIVLKYINI